MPHTPNLSLPYLEAGQAQKHVTLNESLRRLDAVTQLAVAAVSNQPPAEPAEGERHVVGASPSGAFAGHTNEIAAFQDGAWVFLTPQPGWRAWNVAAETLLVWTGSAWSGFSGGGEGDVEGPEGGVADGDVVLFDGATGKAIRKGRGAIDWLGVGAPPDATDTDTSNRLVVKASRALFYAREDAETPGTGDIKLQISKEAEGNSASFFFATNFSGRAEFGLVESDSFALKVSPDGAEWIEALSFDPATGTAAFHRIAGVRRMLTADATFYVDGAAGSDANDGLAPGAAAFATIQKAIDTAAGLDLGIHNVTISVADGTYAPFTLKRCVGAGAVSIVGNLTTPANVHVTSADDNVTIVRGENVVTIYTIRGVKLSAAGGGGRYLLYGSGTTQIRFGNIDFGAATNHIYCDLGALVRTLSGPDGNYTISAGAARHLWAFWGGLIYISGGMTTLSGTPAFSTAFAVAGERAGIRSSGTFSGSATGKRYEVTLNAVINTGGGGAGYYPGNLTGTAASGGEYA